MWLNEKVHSRLKINPLPSDFSMAILISETTKVRDLKVNVSSIPFKEGMYAV